MGGIVTSPDSWMDMIWGLVTVAVVAGAIMIWLKIDARRPNVPRSWE